MSTTPAAETVTPKVEKIPDPAFNASTARAVPAYRHEPTAKTVGFEQPDEGAGKQIGGDLSEVAPAIHLFGFNRLFVATVPASEGRYVPPAPAE